MDTSTVSLNMEIDLNQSDIIKPDETPVYVAPAAENIQQKYYVRESIQPVALQQYVPQQTFINATPLSGLNMSSAPVDCPMCGVRAVTRITFVAGSQTQYAYYNLLIIQCVGDYIVPINRARVSTVYRDKYQRCRA
jgi:LITAF-like zinc ribbon domain